MIRRHIKKPAYLAVLLAFILSSCDAGDAPEAPTPQGTSRLAGLLGAGADSGFPRVTEPRRFVFPDDHGPHPAYRNEWWYFTGNLESVAGERYGYELTLFRFALNAELAEAEDPGWKTNQVYIGHLAITDLERQVFLVAERMSRAALGLAGASSQPPAVWIDHWRIESGEPWRLIAADDGLAIDLELVPAKPVVLQGDAGLSQKSAEVGNASYYYSIPRLETRGTLVVDGREITVRGSSWLDREWGSSALSSEQVGWDWFALQFSDNTELMFYQLRSRNGTIDRHSAGTWIGADGTVIPLAHDAVSITIEDHWTNPRGDRYPAGWRLEAPELGLDVVVRPVMANQELVTTVRYWEGAVDVSGTVSRQTVSGRGYVELTGYAN